MGHHRARWSPRRARVAAVCQRTAVVRLGVRSEQALSDLRTRLIDHIHRISLADHNDERRGALVARVTSDIETLAKFFRWGGLAWLLDGTLMVIVASVMLAYNWFLASSRSGSRSRCSSSCGSSSATWSRRTTRPGGATATCSRRSASWSPAPRRSAPTAPAACSPTVTKRAVRQRSDAQIRGNMIGAFLFPLGRGVLGDHDRGDRHRGVLLGPGAG
jgi:ATP-binding cassette, subfamily B, bacterial